MALDLDVFGEVVAALAAKDPPSLVSLASASRSVHRMVSSHWFRVLCVQGGGGPLDHTLAGGRRGFPLLTWDRFEDLLRSSRRDEVREVRHLHLCGAFGEDAFRAVFDHCALLSTLWLEHYESFDTAPSLRGLDRLRHLRELTLPSTYLTAAAPLQDVVLRAVTHLHLAPVMVYEALHLPALRSFPSLTHLGFAEETVAGCVRRAAESSDTLGVLVRVDWDSAVDVAGGESVVEVEPCIHPRVVYLLVSSALDADWLKRACPAWQGGPVWDQWTFFEATMAARARGELPAAGGLLSERVVDQPSDDCSVLREFSTDSA